MENLHIIIILALICNIFVLYKSLGITFFHRGSDHIDGRGQSLTDNERLIYNAKNYKLFSWPSSVHNMPVNRAQLREFWFLAISIVSKILKKSNNIIIVLLSLLSNVISTICIYVILDKVFNQDTALIISLFYLTALWPYQVSLYVGHVLFSQMWFLFSILVLVFYESFHYHFIPFFLSGIFLTVCFSSSSSSRKFPPLILLLFLFINYDYIINFNIENLYSRLDYFLIFLIIFFVTIFFSNIILQKQINKYINKKSYSQEIVNKIKITKSRYSKKFLLLLIFLALFLFCLEGKTFLYNLLYFFSGISFVGFFILAPNFTGNIARYFAWWDATDWGNHFRSWPSNFFGIDTSGHFIAPISWIPLFLLRIIPAMFILYLFTILCLLIFIDLNFIVKLLVILISLIPLIIMEITKAGKLARAYFPILVGFLFLISFVYYNLNSNEFLNIIFYSFLFLQIIHTLYFIFTDVLPTRMCSANLKKALIKKKIFEFSTYDNTFNDANVFPMIAENPNSFEINFSDNIISSKTKYFIVPGISSKSISFECNSEVIKSGDFKSDKDLNYLIENKLIDKCSVIKLPTLGCSKFYVLESEVTSFRSLIIKDIHQKDIDLGYLYVLDCDLVRKYIT